MIDLQHELSKKLDQVINKVSAVVTNESSDPEISTLSVLRTFDDFSSDIDNKLKRRCVDSPKFAKAAEDIKAAIKSGSFVINVVAPEYSKNKDLVDLVVSTALTDSSSLSEDASLADKRKDRENRQKKHEDSIISDIDVAGVVSAYGADAPKYVEATVDTGFFGTDFFDPENSINCLYEYITDYQKSPVPPAPEQEQNAAGIEPLSDREVSRARRNTGGFEVDGNPHETFDFNEHKGKAILRSPMGSPANITEEPAAVPQSLFFDERAGNVHLRFDPRNPMSYRYPYMSNRFKNAEAEAAGNYRSSIENGLADNSLNKKWVLMMQILSKIQGVPLISLFHAGGFEVDDQGVNRSRAYGENAPAFPDISDDVIERALLSFLASLSGGGGVDINIPIGDDPAEGGEASGPVFPMADMSTGGIAKRMYAEEGDAFFDWSSAQVNEWIDDEFGPSVMQEKGAAVFQYKENSNHKNAITRSASNTNNLNGIIALAQKEFDLNEDIPYSVFADWASEELGQDGIGYAPIIWATVKKNQNKYANLDSETIKTAATAEVLQSDLYKKLVDIVTNQKGINEVVSSSISSEYIVDLFIKHLVNTCLKGAGVSSSEDSPETVPKGDDSAILNPGDYMIPVTLSKDESDKWIRENGSGISIVDSRGDIIETVEVEEVEESDNGSLWYITEVIKERISGSYSLVKSGGNTGLSSLGDDLYSSFYSSPNPIRRAHKANGVSLSFSILPSWSPAPYDLRPQSEPGTGHPNNPHNLKKALQDRIALRTSYISEMSYSQKSKKELEPALDTLEQEIGEIQLFLNQFAAHKYPNRSSAIVDTRDPSLSMTREKEHTNASLFKEIARRCQTEDIEVGSYGASVGAEALKEILGEEKFNRFEEIKKEVIEGWASRKNVFLIRSADTEISAQTGNGFMVETGAGERAKRGWAPGFEAKMKQLHSKVAGQAGSAGADPKALNSHVVIISEKRIPNLVVEPAYIDLHTSTMSYEEISSFVDFYTGRVKEQYLSSLPEDQIEVEDGVQTESERLGALAAEFIVPDSFIRKLQSALANLDFQRLDEFIFEIIGELFETYMNLGSVIKALDANKNNFNRRIEDFGTTDKNLEDLGIRCTSPRFSIDEYVTEKGSSWGDHVTGELKNIIESITAYKAKADFFARAVDTGIGFCTLSGTEPKEEDGEQYTEVSVSFPSPNASQKMVWFSLNDLVVEPGVQPDNSLLELAKPAGYSIDGNLFEAVGSDALVVKNEESLNAYEDKISGEIKSLDAEIRAQKTSYPPIIALEGSPGTGKSIYAEVLASALDCKYLATTLSNMAYSGKRGKFRGEVEQNLERMVSTMKSMTDSVLLIDEIDKFLDSSSGSDNKDVEICVEKLLTAWEDDRSTYSENNFHIICTCNYWEKFVAKREAIASRLRDFHVDLPSSYETLMELFSGNAIVNNLINNKCGDDVSLAEMAKEMVSLWGSDDPQDQAIIEMYRKIIDDKKPGFFINGAIVRPLQAERQMMASMNLPTPEEPIDAVEDFVKGYIEIGEILHGMNQAVDVNVKIKATGDIESKKINPMQAMCSTLSEKMTYPTDPTRHNAEKYARTNIREINNIFQRIFELHQRAKSGEGMIEAGPKLIKLILDAQTFSTTVDVDRLSEDDRDDSTLMNAIETDKSQDGITFFRSFMSASNIKTGLAPPPEFWMTDAQLKKSVESGMEMIAAAGLDEDGDGGARFLANKAINAFGNDSILTQIELSNEVLTEAEKYGRAKSKGTTSFFNGFIQVREVVRTLAQQILAGDFTQFGQLFIYCENMFEVFENFDYNYGQAVKGLFNQSNASGAGIAYTNISVGMSIMGGCIESIRKLNLYKDGGEVDEITSKIRESSSAAARKSLDLSENKSLKLFAQNMIGNQTLDEERYNELVVDAPTEDSEYEFNFKQMGDEKRPEPEVVDPIPEPPPAEVVDPNPEPPPAAVAEPIPEPPPAAVAKKEDEMDEINLFGDDDDSDRSSNTTDYYSKIAYRVIKEKIKVKAIEAKRNRTLGDIPEISGSTDILFNSNIHAIADAFRNRETLRFRLKKVPYNTESTSSFRKITVSR